MKPSYNAKFDISRIKDAEYFIETSNIICIYGMSLGESDESWVTKLREWLLLDSDHHLFYYVYSEYSFSDWNSDEKMDEEDERKQVLLDRLFSSKEVAEQVYEQVHIPVGYDIFDILNKFRPTDIV